MSVVRRLLEERASTVLKDNVRANRCAVRAG